MLPYITAHAILQAVAMNRQKNPVKDLSTQQKKMTTLLSALNVVKSRSHLEQFVLNVQRGSYLVKRIQVINQKTQKTKIVFPQTNIGHAAIAKRLIQSITRNVGIAEI